MLTILLATCEVTLETAARDGIPLNPGLVADLERLAERTRVELNALADPQSSA